jgi:hypothetical protein
VQFKARKKARCITLTKQFVGGSLYLIVAGLRKTPEVYWVVGILASEQTEALWHDMVNGSAIAQRSAFTGKPDAVIIQL